MADSWRDRFRPHIAAVIAAYDREAGASIDPAVRLRSLRKLLVCPDGLRGYWPGKVWLDEVNVQLGRKRSRAFRSKRAVDPAPGQSELF